MGPHRQIIPVTGRIALNKCIEELSIEVTNECTLACLHCSSGSMPKKGADELQYHEHARLLKEARVLGAKTLSLSGGNPLLYNNLLKLTSKAVDLGFERVLIYTTGHNRHRSTIEYLDNIDGFLDLGKVTWIFSLHSHQNAVNDRLMNHPWAFSDIVRSIHWLKEQNAAVEIHMVPMKPNYMHIPDVRDLCADLGVEKMSLLRFVPQTRGKEHIDELGMDKMDFIRMQMIITDEFKREHSVELRAGCPIDFRHSIGALSAKAKPCHAGDDLMLVRPNGSVHPCAAWKSLPSDSNVRNDNLTEIWTNSHTFQAIREFKADGYKMVSGCASCTLLESCKTGCPAQRLHAYGRKSMDDLYLGCSDPLCPKGNNGCEVENV